MSTEKVFFINELHRLKARDEVREAMKNQKEGRFIELLEEEKKLLGRSILTDYFATKNNLMLEKKDLPKGMLYETIFLMFAVKKYNYSAELFKDRVELSDLLIEEEDPILANILLFMVEGIPIAELTIDQILGIEVFK